MTIAIVGAGIAGLSAATTLTAQGRAVALFDKGRGAGGRMATRRASLDGADISFDHGAQYFTARSDAFRAAVAEWIASGVVAPWDEAPAPGGGFHRLVGVPGMNAVLKAMAAPVDVSWGAEVRALERRDGDWHLVFTDGTEAGPFEMVIVAVPAEQAARLLAPVAPDLAGTAKPVRSDPCWTVMAAYTSPTGIDAFSLEPVDGPIGWAARNSSKAGRAAAETWVLQARADWSATHLEDAPETVTAHLLEIFCRLTGAGAPDFVQAHRWRYARVAEPVGVPFLLDRPKGLATCGDWHLGARVEAAWLSGHLLGKELLS